MAWRGVVASGAACRRAATAARSSSQPARMVSSSALAPGGPRGEDGIGGQLLDEPVGGGDTLAGADGVVVQLGQQVGRAVVVAAVMPIAAHYLGDGLVVDVAGLGGGGTCPLR